MGLSPVGSDLDFVSTSNRNTDGFVCDEQCTAGLAGRGATCVVTSFVDREPESWDVSRSLSRVQNLNEKLGHFCQGSSAEMLCI